MAVYIFIEEEKIYGFFNKDIIFSILVVTLQKTMDILQTFHNSPSATYDTHFAIKQHVMSKITVKMLRDSDNIYLMHNITHI